MDFRALETLRTIGSQGGVTAAAAVLHLTPSAVSQQMAVLQREAGVPLTERVGRGLRLTPAGEALAAAAVDVAVALERAQAACDAFLERPEGIVRVSAFQSGAELLLPGLLTRVGRLPGIRLECTDEDVAQEDFAALTDRIDIVVAHRPEDAPAWPGVRVVPLLREPLDVAVPLDHPLASRDAVWPSDLVDAAWISVRVGFPIASLVTEVAARSGDPHPAARTSDASTSGAGGGAGGAAAVVAGARTAGAAAGAAVPSTAGAGTNAGGTGTAGVGAVGAGAVGAGAGAGAVGAGAAGAVGGAGAAGEGGAGVGVDRIGVGWSGPAPRIVHRVNDFHVVEALVGAGHGIALLPRYTFGGSARIRLVPLEGVRAGRRIDALLRPDRAERVVVRRVLHELQTLAREIAPLE